MLETASNIENGGVPMRSPQRARRVYGHQKAICEDFEIKKTRAD